VNRRRGRKDEAQVEGLAAVGEQRPQGAAP
jgi:hypothetical protein